MGRALDVRINRRRGGPTSPSASTNLSIIEVAKLLATSSLGAMKLCKIPRDVGQLGATFLPARASSAAQPRHSPFFVGASLESHCSASEYFPRFDLCLRTLDFFLSRFIRIALAGNRAFFMRSISQIHPSNRIIDRHTRGRQGDANPEGEGSRLSPPGRRKPKWGTRRCPIVVCRYVERSYWEYCANTCSAS